MKPIYLVEVFVFIKKVYSVENEDESCIKGIYNCLRKQPACCLLLIFENDHIGSTAFIGTIHCSWSKFTAYISDGKIKTVKTEKM